MVALNIHPNPALYLSPEMLAELALGSEKPEEIAARYGLSQAEWAKLNSQDWFGELVARKRIELEQQGHVFATKARMMAEEASLFLFKRVITGQTTDGVAIDFLENMLKAADLMPRPQGGPAGGSGPAFQINIQVNGTDVAKAQTKRLDLEPEKELPVISIPMQDELPPKPEGFVVPNFDLDVRRRDLVGSPTAVQAAVAPAQVPR